MALTNPQTGRTGAARSALVPRPTPRLPSNGVRRTTCAGKLPFPASAIPAPSFTVSAPLLSRCRVLTLRGLDDGAIAQVVERAASDRERGLGQLPLEFAEGTLGAIVQAADGVWPLVITDAAVGLELDVVVGTGSDRQASFTLSGIVVEGFLHVVGDTLGSVGAIAAAIIMMTTGFYLADPLVSFFVALLIVISAMKLIRQSVDVLLEGVPPHLDVDEIKAALLEIEGVTDVHDLHVWTITSGFDSLTAHLVLEDDAPHQQVLEASHKMLTDRFGLDHSTLQPEQHGLTPCGDPARS